MKKAAVKDDFDYLVWKVNHPSRSVVQAVLALGDAERHGRPVTLPLRQVSTLLTHVRSLTRLVRWQRDRLDPEALRKLLGEGEACGV